MKMSKTGSGYIIKPSELLSPNFKNIEDSSVFVQTAKNTPPSIVGVAIKRSLKLSEDWNKTLLGCAPLNEGEFNETDEKKMMMFQNSDYDKFKDMEKRIDLLCLNVVDDNNKSKCSLEKFDTSIGSTDDIKELSGIDVVTKNIKIKDNDDSKDIKLHDEKLLKCTSCGRSNECDKSSCFLHNGDILTKETVQCASHLLYDDVDKTPSTTIATAETTSTITIFSSNACAKECTHSVNSTSFINRCSEIDSSIDVLKNSQDIVLFNETSIESETLDSSSKVSERDVVELKQLTTPQHSNKNKLLFKEDSVNLNECLNLINENCDKTNELLIKDITKDYSDSESVKNNLCDEENFVASNRLKRLEERFKDFSYTKKLLRDTKSASAEDVSSSSSFSLQINSSPPPLPSQSSTTTHISCLQEQHKNNETNSFKDRPKSCIDPIILTPTPIQTQNKKILVDKNGNTILKSPKPDTEESLNEENSSFEINLGSVLAGDLYTSCEFDVRHLEEYGPDFGRVYECYDELEEEEEEEENEQTNSCDCIIEAIPIYRPLSVMRATTGPLKGLLKKPNRPPPVRKNRVIFDETRNEFFEADYIILIREDCPYDEEDEEPCTCGEHELVRLCCEEGCQCPGYTDDCRTPQSPKFAPPIEFVDQATLSPPDGYKDGGALSNALGGALGGRVFGAQHIQQLQVIQRLQAQRAAMLAARATTATGTNPTQVAAAAVTPTTAVSVSPTPQVQQIAQPVCTECAECAECAAKQMQDDECESPCSEETSPIDAPRVALVPIKTTSPERRITQKEIIAGEERPKYLSIKHHEPEDGLEKIRPLNQNQRFIVETITMTTVTERRIVREAATTEDITGQQTNNTVTNSQISTGVQYDNNSTIAGEQGMNTGNITGILKGGKLRKTDSIQCDDMLNITSDDEGSSKRSVRFNEIGLKDTTNESIEREICDGEVQCDEIIDEDEQQQQQQQQQILESDLVPTKKQTSIFHNALRPNSAVRQLFPSTSQPPPPASSQLTLEALRAFEEAKRGPLTTKIVHSDSETDTIRRTIERNALRRSLIKYEPKKKPQRMEPSLEERIRQLTCDIDDLELANHEQIEEMERRDSPAGEENPQPIKYIPDKSFSPSSSASSSSSGSTSAYRKITDIFHRDKRHEKIPEADENPIVIIPQDCRCPAAPDLGIGIQMPATHTQIHQTPPRQNESRRQFLSTLVPLTACVAGQRDDLSYYTLAPGDRTSTSSSQYSEYSLGDIEAVLSNGELKKVAPDVIAGTPGQETDELIAFAQQDASRTEKLKKRYSAESASAPGSGAASDDDEQNDYGFNKRPSVRGIKPRFGSTNEILQQMQAQLAQPPQSQIQIQTQTQTVTQMQSHTLPKQQQQAAQLAAKQQQAIVAHQQQIAAHHHQQHTSAWAYYPDNQQRTTVVSSADHSNANYYHLPARQSFQGHEESTIYQNCQSVSMEQHQYGRFARSPTRRPESPPPLRNYHQTMVLIPYNTEPYAHYSSNDQNSGQQFQRHNLVEYQQVGSPEFSEDDYSNQETSFQVTQQTIRVPMGYPLPGMQLHVVTGRGGQNHPHYAQHTQQQQYPRLAAAGTRNFIYSQDKTGVKYTERGAPEGAAATVPQTDCNQLMSPTSGPQQNNGQQNVGTPGAVFYAMNV